MPLMRCCDDLAGVDNGAVVAAPKLIADLNERQFGEACGRGYMAT
jgi:hypothetical protein